MKRSKLKTWVKVVILLILDIVIYRALGNYGYLAVENDIALGLIVLGWAYLFIGQFLVASLVCPELDI